MRKELKHFFWIFSNEWGGVLGWQWLTPLHRVFLNLSLHALGYDNPYYSGEGWFIRNVLGAHDIQVAMDIGANVGNYSLALTEEIDCVVYAVEPLSSSFSALQEKAQKSQGKIIPFNFALADFIGEAIIAAKTPYAETATLELGAVEEGLEERISVLTLDQLVKREGIARLDFIKIDTEGFEREVAMGMQKSLVSLKPKFIQFEFNIMQLRRGYTVLEMQKLLQGYTLYRLLPHGWFKINPNAFADNIFMFQNIVAVRNDIY